MSSMPLDMHALGVVLTGSENHVRPCRHPRTTPQIPRSRARVRAGGPAVNNVVPIIHEHGDSLLPLSPSPNGSTRKKRGTPRTPQPLVTHDPSTNANFPTDNEGRTYHLGTKRGEVANRILSVGSVERAHLLSELLEPVNGEVKRFEHMSSRGFLTVTGRFNGVPVSIVSTHMGIANMDFVVRECRAVTSGEMAFIRLGTCGAVQPPASLGCLLVASQGSIFVRRDPDAFVYGSTRRPYQFSLPAPSDVELSSILVRCARQQLGDDRVVQGMNATADSFYSSQGRTGEHFDDRNEALIPEMLARYPSVVSLEMETFHLLDLARCSNGSVRATAFCIALAERYSNRFIDKAAVQELEVKGGRAALTALTSVALRDEIKPGERRVSEEKAHHRVPDLRELAVN